MTRASQAYGFISAGMAPSSTSPAAARRIATLLAAVEQLPIADADADLQHTLAAAHLKAALPISYADAFALALAVDLEAALVTGDPEFRAAENLVEVVWLS